MTAGGQEGRAPRPYADVPGFAAEGPVDLAALCGPRPIELEIGFGRGRFAVERALAEPGAAILAVETRRKFVHTAAALAAKHGAANAIFRYGDARAVIARFVPDGAVARIFVNFPDPWWKTRHAKRAVVNGDLLGEAARLLRPGGELFVQTDVEDRAEAFRALLAREPRLAPAAADGRVDANPYAARSNREVRCLDAGVPIFRLLYRRR